MCLPLCIHAEHWQVEHDSFTWTTSGPVGYFDLRGCRVLEAQITLAPFFLVQHYECPVTLFREFCKELTSYLRQLRIHSNWPLSFLTLKSPSSCQEAIWKTPHKGLWGFVVNSRSLWFLPELSSSFSPSKQCFVLLRPLNWVRFQVEWFGQCDCED